MNSESNEPRLPESDLEEAQKIEVRRRSTYESLEWESSSEGITTMLNEAISANPPSQIEIIYDNQLGVRKKRVIEPTFIGVIEYQGRIFDGITAYDHYHQENRNFNIKRIRCARWVQPEHPTQRAAVD